MYVAQPKSVGEPAGFSLAILDALAVPAGEYFTSATVQLLGVEESHDCELNFNSADSLAGSTQIDQATAGVSSVQVANPLVALQGSADLATAGWIIVACVPGSSPIVAQATISALEVASVTDVAG